MSISKYVIILPNGGIFMIGKQIKQMRTASGFSQAELSAILGIAQNTLSGYETGSSMPNYDMVEKIAALCEFDILFVDINSEEAIGRSNLSYEKQ